MKDMSFGKMLGLFGGFLLLMVVVAVVIVKMNAKGGNSGGKPVTTKTFQKQPVAEAPAVDPATQAAPAGQGNEQAVFQPMGNNQATLQAAGQGAAQGVAQGAASAINPLAAHQVPQVVPNDLGQHLSSIDTTLEQLDARLAALESKRSPGMGRIGTGNGATQKSGQQATAGKSKSTKAVEETAGTTELPGYKSMAVVANRAWVAAPDGNEDSMVKGEPIPAPRPRVRSMNVDSGVVITTTDQRIEPNVEQRINQRPDQRISPNVDQRFYPRDDQR